MTYEQTVLAAFIAAAGKRGLSNRQLTILLAQRFGQWAPAFRTVDRVMKGETKMTMQQAEMIGAVLEVHPGRVLAGLTPGQAAEYRCILPTVPPVANMQVRGLIPDRRQDAPCCAHAA